MQLTNEPVRQAVDAVDATDAEAFRDVHAEDVVLQTPSSDHHGLDAVTESQMLDEEPAFPDRLVSIDTMIEEGELVAVRWPSPGPHERKADGVEPTGAEVDYEENK